MDTTEDSLVLRLFGERWSIDLSGYADPSRHADELRGLWARSVDDAPGDADVVLSPVTEGASDALHPRIADRTDGAFPYAFSRAVTQAAIARHAGSALLLHAAGLVSPDGGRCVVMVAASGTGKSTAARTLGQDFGYLSDELIMVDADQRVRGLTKPLSIIVPGFPGGKEESSPDALGLGPTPASPPALAALVSLSREPEAGAPQLEPISLHDVIAEVVPQTSSLWRVERPLQHLAEAASHGGGPYRLRYAEIAEARELVAGLFEKTDAAPPAWQEHLPGESDRWVADDASIGAPGDRLVRAPWTDAIEQDGEISVLAGSRFTRVAGIAATIWLLCAEAHSEGELVDALTREHGEHPDAAELVRSAVGELRGRGLLTAVASSGVSPRGS
ncbi:hypothetical protein DY023_01990 [Microbacterium bovistercoris]|uniref:PqqD family peptide modification chaperone n=1 Tax=Microbacterium bovistercoris TaxID=2293570 RepID=A0A371NXM8_9MICO|nr:PqqD family protein [Microbacterium bovistercoris]REJ08059.1 hypothetical protein DY023_01990 [Microbacterium bovistercoris]